MGILTGHSLSYNAGMPTLTNPPTRARPAPSSFLAALGIRQRAFAALTPAEGLNFDGPRSDATVSRASCGALPIDGC